MYQFDHILHGKGSRQHVQEMIRQAEQDKLAREIEAAASQITIQGARLPEAVLKMSGR